MRKLIGGRYAHMNLIEALEEIEKAPQGNARLAKLAEYNSPELQVFLFQALSPSVTFGVKQLPNTDFINNEFGSDEEWYTELMLLSRPLMQRYLTGNDARSTIDKFLKKCNSLQLKWAKRFLAQDLRINIGAKEVNKALGEDVIPLFSVALATDFTKVKDFKGKWALSPKADGARLVAVLPANKGPVKLLSRTGKEWPGFDTIRQSLQTYSDRLDLKEDIYLDGEVVSYVNDQIDFQSIQQTMLRKDGKEIGRLVYYIFDAAVASEWYNPKEKYLYRFLEASKIVTSMNLSNILPIPTKYIENPSKEDLVAWGEEMVLRGWEGAMVRRPDVPVDNKRSKNLLKIKSFSDEEAIIADVVEGTGKYQGMMGAVKCNLSTGEEFEIGSGFNDSQREDFWLKKNELVGSLVTFKYFEKTRDNIPRFPIFKGLRSKEDTGE